VVCAQAGRRIWRCLESPQLRMRQFSDDFLQDYLAEEGRTVADSAGGYRIEGPGVQLFDTVEGSWDVIQGLPLLPLLGFLRQAKQTMGEAREERLLARAQPIKVRRKLGAHYEFGAMELLDLSDMDAVLMRQDPPFDMAYITATHMLEHIHPRTLVVNDPAN